MPAWICASVGSGWRSEKTCTLAPPRCSGDLVGHPARLAVGVGDQQDLAFAARRFSIAPALK